MTAPAEQRVGDGGETTSLARNTAMMTVLTLVSRATGLVRIVLVGAVVGTTYLGNTYESTNTIPNVVFELMAAGTFQAVLIPALVLSVGVLVWWKRIGPPFDGALA